MTVNLLNYASLAAFVLLTIGICFQIKKTIKVKHVRGISIAETALRTAACMVLLAKFIAVKDPYLIMGQSVFNAAYLVFFVLALIYSIRTKRTGQVK